MAGFVERGKISEISDGRMNGRISAADLLCPHPGNNLAGVPSGSFETK